MLTDEEKKYYLESASDHIFLYKITNIVAVIPAAFIVYDIIKLTNMGDDVTAADITGALFSLMLMGFFFIVAFVGAASFRNTANIYKEIATKPGFGEESKPETKSKILLSFGKFLRKHL